MSVWVSMPLVGCVGYCDGCDECEQVGSAYIYGGSHVLPEANHGRAGEIDCAYLSNFVRHYRNEGLEREEPDGIEPWLRLSVRALHGADTVVLDRKQVEVMAGRLLDWLATLDAPPA